MYKFVILLSAVTCALGAAVPEGMLPQLDGRIVGGSPTTISEYPWQISLQRYGSHSCGGSVISPICIVTAAHCLQSVSASVLQARAGSTYWSSGGVLVGVATYKVHEGYNSRLMTNDIAIIRLSSSLTMGPNIRAIAMAIEAPANDANAVVSGWGTTKFGSSSLPNDLQFVEVKIVRRNQCESDNYGYGSEIRETMICAFAVDKDACQGDSGGPLVSDNVLVGVVSWGYGCAQAEYPGVYADVSDLRSWVEAADSEI